jgi:hypothetical protein
MASLSIPKNRSEVTALWLEAALKAGSEKNDKTLPAARHHASQNLEFLGLNKEINHYFGCTNKSKYKPVGIKVKPSTIGKTFNESPFEWQDKVKSTGEQDATTWIASLNERIASRTTIRIDQERLATMHIGAPGFLTVEEIQLCEKVLLANDKAFSFELSEIGLIKDSIIPPYEIRTVPLEAHSLKPYPIAKSLFEPVKDMIRGKLKMKMLEPTQSVYSNRWFVIRKSQGPPRLLIDMHRSTSIPLEMPWCLL